MGSDSDTGRVYATLEDLVDLFADLIVDDFSPAVTVLGGLGLAS